MAGDRNQGMEDLQLRNTKSCTYFYPLERKKTGAVVEVRHHCFRVKGKLLPVLPLTATAALTESRDGRPTTTQYQKLHLF